MLKKVINYVDFNGQPQSETHYFHMNRMEAVKFQAKYGGDLEAYARSLSQSSTKENFEFIEDLVLTAYGERTPDGRGFNKSKEVVDRFRSSLAYDALFEELVTVDGAAGAFGAGLGPVNAQPNLQAVPNPEPKQPAVHQNIQEASTADLLERIKKDPVLRAQLLGE